MTGKSVHRTARCDKEARKVPQHRLLRGPVVIPHEKGKGKKKKKTLSSCSQFCFALHIKDLKLMNLFLN